MPFGASRTEQVANRLERLNILTNNFHHGQVGNNHKHSGQPPNHSACNKRKDDDQWIDLNIGTGDIGSENVIFKKLYYKKLPYNPKGNTCCLSCKYKNKDNSIPDNGAQIRNEIENRCNNPK